MLITFHWQLQPKDFNLGGFLSGYKKVYVGLKFKNLTFI